MTVAKFPFHLLCFLGLLASSCGIAPAHGGQVHISSFAGSFSVPVKSLKEARWDRVIRQQYDFSCGSAAVATLLSYHYETPMDEAQVFQAMFRAGDQAKIQAEGFSMLDMKRFLDNQGLHSDGFRMSLDQLVQIGVPGIVLVNTQGYRHFVVVRGLRDDRVLLADPAIGSITVPRAHFEQIWDGTVLAARGNIQVARENFNSIQDWEPWPTAPITRGMNRTGLGMFVLSLPGRNEFGR
jgi:uncharacterized protein